MSSMRLLGPLFGSASSMFGYSSVQVALTLFPARTWDAQCDRAQSIRRLPDHEARPRRYRCDGLRAVSDVSRAR